MSHTTYKYGSLPGHPGTHRIHRTSRTDIDPVGFPQDEPVNRPDLDATQLFNSWTNPVPEYSIETLDYTSTTRISYPEDVPSNLEYYGKDHIPGGISQVFTPQGPQGMPSGAYQSPHTWSGSPDTTVSDSESFSHESPTSGDPTSYPSPERSPKNQSNVAESPAIEKAECKEPRFHCNFPTCRKQGLVFDRQSAYKRHSEKHTKPHLCYHKHCKRSKPGYGFSRPDNLRTHLKSKKHEGTRCCSTYPSEANLEEIKRLKRRLQELEG
ncbi:hypothetical protein EDC01DRAFT_240111 [Geopyxis carbonaria]|nr:hypothetical protein EDC01DRAFT_240111 [Geopyxis carbonaria]